MSKTAGVAPAILRQHPELNHGQLELVGHLDGPTRGVAGPGTGKTLAVALRGANALLQGLAKPEELVLCTYSRAAARELGRRFTTLATAAGCTGDLSSVRIGTIHGLCRRILRSHARGAGLRRGVEILNEDEQWHLLFRHYDDVFGPDLDLLEREGWRWREPHLVIRNAGKHFARICDELIEPRALVHSGDPFHAALGRCYERYRDLLLVEGTADFDHLQRWAAELLENDNVADPISDRIRYLVCDEYQDTSHVQERLLLRLSRTHGNLCVVGDDDQANLPVSGCQRGGTCWSFPTTFHSCHTVELSANHRSHPDIVGFYDRWMARAADWSNPDPNGRAFLPLSQVASRPTTCAGVSTVYPAVIAVEGRDVPRTRGSSWRSWCMFLKRRGVIAQIQTRWRCCLHSVKGPSCGHGLPGHLREGAGIPVNRVPSGSGGGRRADTRHSVTVTTIHQAKGREWDVVIVGSLKLRQLRCGPGGKGAAVLSRSPRLRAGRPHRGVRSRAPALRGSFSRPKGICWCSPPAARCIPASKMRLGPPAPLGSDGPQGAGPPKVPTTGGSHQHRSRRRPSHI